MLKAKFCTLVSGMICLLYAPQSLAQNKPTCAVLTFDARVGVSVPESQMLSDRFAAEFDRLDRYTIVARSMMREILDEQKFQAMDHCSAAACAVEAGQLLGVRYMVYGTIGRLGGYTPSTVSWLMSKPDNRYEARRRTLKAKSAWH